MASSESLSIGEVLDLLTADFPDVTISKIRFLESQGLLDPERTASGYRKFYQDDVERLRWILRQQKENFLPLKVIKDRLEAGEVAPAAAGVTEAVPSPQPPPAPAPAPAPARVPVAVAGADAGAASRAAGSGPPAAARVDDASPPTYSRDELARASGLGPSDLSQLERHGLLVGVSVGSQLTYDAQALEVARLAAAFSRHGVEPRHLRMYKNSAEREVGFYEQVVLPLVKQRNPAARAQALATLDELAGLGDSLRAALRRRALRDFDATPAPKARRRS